MFTLSVSLIVPVRAHFVELEAYIRLWIIDRDLLDPRRNRVFVNAFVCCHVSKRLHLSLAIRVAQEILCPRDCMPTIAPVELVLVAWEMAASKFLVAANEMYRTEFSSIRLAPSIDVARSPARIDQLPLAIVNLDDVPGMATCIFRRYWCSRG